MNYEELVVKVLKSLGHPVRYKIVKFLYDGPECVCKINESFSFSQANLSQHLKILKDSGILKSQKVGLETHYSLYDDSIKDIVDSVEGYVDMMISRVKI